VALRTFGAPKVLGTFEGSHGSRLLGMSRALGLVWHEHDIEHNNTTFLTSRLSCI
jgi:hypothetical protein